MDKYKVYIYDIWGRVNAVIQMKIIRNKSGKLSQDTPVLPQVVKLGHAPNKIQV